MTAVEALDCTLHCTAACAATVSQTKNEFATHLCVTCTSAAAAPAAPAAALGILDAAAAELPLQMHVMHGIPYAEAPSPCM